MSFYNDYIAPAWNTAKDWYGTGKEYYKDFRAGYEYGDEDPGSGSWAYLAGDYLEDAYDIGKTLYKGYSAFVDKSTDGRPLPTPGRVSSSAGSSYSPGSFTASKTDFSKVGYSDPRVQAAFQRASQSQIPSIAATVQRVGLTSRSGRRTIDLPTSDIKITTQVS